MKIEKNGNGILLSNLEICTLLASARTTNPEARKILQEMQEYVNQLEQEHKREHKRGQKQKLEM